MDIRINLLPDEKKQEIRGNRRFAFVLWQGVFILSLSILYGWILIGLHITLDSRLKALQLETKIKNEDSIIEVQKYGDIFREANDRVEFISRFQMEHIRWSRTLLSLNDLVPNGVTMERISSKDYQLLLAGKAQTRDVLLEFQDKMNASDCFQNAKVPLSDLFSQKDIKFQMDLEVKPSCLKPSKS